MEIKTANTATDITKCRQVMLALRPHLSENNSAVTRQEMMTGGYQLPFITEDHKVIAVIGYRYLQHLYTGNHFYIDDLSTLPACGGRGYAGKLPDYVVAKAREKDMDA